MEYEYGMYLTELPEKEFLKELKNGEKKMIDHVHFTLPSQLWLH